MIHVRDLSRASKLRLALKIGLFVAIAMQYLIFVGIIETFHDRFLIKDVISLGETIMLLVFAGSGYLAVWALQKSTSWSLIFCRLICPAPLSSVAHPASPALARRIFPSLPPLPPALSSASWTLPPSPLAPLLNPIPVSVTALIPSRFAPSALRVTPTPPRALIPGLWIPSLRTP